MLREELIFKFKGKIRCSRGSQFLNIHSHHLPLLPVEDAKGSKCNQGVGAKAPGHAQDPQDNQEASPHKPLIASQEAANLLSDNRPDPVRQLLPCWMPVSSPSLTQAINGLRHLTVQTTTAL